MAAAIGRHLHQSLDEVEEWEADRFFRYFDAMGELLEAEAPKG